MNTIALRDFLSLPDDYLRNASVGETIKVVLSSGYSAIIIDEPQWEMLQQALKLCTEHPEWLNDVQKGERVK